jgi:hypothetical protein
MPVTTTLRVVPSCTSSSSSSMRDKTHTQHAAVRWQPTRPEHAGCFRHMQINQLLLL